MTDASAARVTWDTQSFSASAGGFQWTQVGGRVVEGPWSRVTQVMTFVASATVSGAHVGTWQHFGVTFDTGEHFTFSSRDAEAFEVARLTVTYAGPLIVKRLASQLSAGHTLTFGPLSLSQWEVGFKKKKWPLKGIAGHRTFQGHWMMDTGPKAAPKLTAQVMLNQVPNFFAFKALLDQLAPGLDYGDDAPDLGTALRPSASSHDPRYPAGRTRLLVMGGLVAVGVLAGLGVLGYNFWVSHQYAVAREAGEARLGGWLQAAQQISIPPGAPYTCPRSVEDIYGVVFATRGPEGVKRPGLLHPDEPFDLGSSGASVVSPFARPKYFVLGEVRGRSPADRTVTMALSVLDTESREVVCSGELTGRYRESYEYAEQAAMERLLVLALCRNPKDSTCNRALEGVELVSATPEPPPAATPEPAPPPEKKAPAKKPVTKKKRKR